MLFIHELTTTNCEPSKLHTLYHLTAQAANAAKGKGTLHFKSAGQVCAIDKKGADWDQSQLCH